MSGLLRQLLYDLPDRQRYRTIARLVILALAAVSVYGFAVLIQEGEYLWALIPALVLGILSVSEFVLADLVLDSRFPRETEMFLERLQRKLSTTSTHGEIRKVLSACVDSFRGCDRDRISSTIHLTIETVEAGTSTTSRGLIQISDYTRSDLGGRRWRVLKATQGIVGRCVRAREMVYVNFRSDAEYRKRMVEEFGFTRAETDQHTNDGRSYLAFPLVSSDDLVGVIYFFSTEPQVFPIAVDRTVLERNAAIIVGFLRTAEIL